MSALHWTLKSTYELARDLQAKGYRASAELVRRLLHQMGYSFQTPAKQNEGTAHSDRDGHAVPLGQRSNLEASDPYNPGREALLTRILRLRPDRGSRFSNSVRPR